MPDVPAVRDLTSRVAEIFTDSGSLAQSLPTFESRPAQRHMAEAVAATLESGGVLLVEAGTGTGKTSVPRARHPQRPARSSSRPARRISRKDYFKDLAVLRKALDVPFTAT